MYQHGPGASIGAGAGAAGGLAATGAGDLLWMFLAGFALIALGMAVWRMVPRGHD